MRYCLDLAASMFPILMLGVQESSDGTERIAREYTKNVFLYPAQSPEESRDELMGHVTTPWAFFLDADEYPSMGLVEFLRGFAPQDYGRDGFGGPDAFRFPRINYIDGFVVEANQDRDEQFKLLRSGVRWNPVGQGQRIHINPQVSNSILVEVPIYHHRSLEKIRRQTARWNELEPGTKVLCDVYLQQVEDAVAVEGIGKSVKGELMADSTGNGWGEFYSDSVVTAAEAQTWADAHKELFWLIEGFAPDRVIEDGCGTGAMSAYLSCPRHNILGVRPSFNVISSVTMVDSSKQVLEVAFANVKALNAQVTPVCGDALTLRQDADLIFSQGLLEHFSDAEMRALVVNELRNAPVVIHSVPNSNYPKQDFGNERLLSDDDFYRVFEGLDVTAYPYWGQGDDRQMTVLVFKREQAAPLVSIVMPVYNNRARTISAIEAVRQHTLDYELIVVDNGSCDGIESWLDKQTDLRVLHLNVNLGVPAAKNLGIALARGEYVCFLDNDALVGDGWIDGMVEVMQDTEVGFTGYWGFKVDLGSHRFQGHECSTGESDVHWMSHSVFMFRRSSVRQTGLLVDRGLWCAEDVDHCLRLRKAGYQGRMPKRSVNVQHPTGTTALTLPGGVAAFPALEQRVWDEWSEELKGLREPVKLDIGVGKAPYPGFTHVDIQHLDHVEIVAPADNIPLDDGSVDEIRASHLIEHFDLDGARSLLGEWERLLRPGGVLHIICPDIARVCRQLASGEVDYDLAIKWIYGGHLDQYDCHNWGYTPTTLRALVSEFGFDGFTVDHDSNGWLDLVARRAGGVVHNPTATVNVSMTHHNVFGGGENYSFQLLRALQSYHPTVDAGAFGVNPLDFGLPKLSFTRGSQSSDIFINNSWWRLETPRGGRNIAVVFYPMYDWKDRIRDFEVVTISEFSRREIRRKWGVESTVIYPCIDLSKFHAAPKKKRQIVSVGRFFRDLNGHEKKQLEMIEIFKYHFKGWKLVLVGQIEDRALYDSCVRMADGADVEFRHDLSFDDLTRLYAESEVYWHFAGFEVTGPSACEHFGIAPLEAVASGCRTFVHGSGGPPEIPGVIVWNTPEELIALMNRGGAGAVPDLTKFSTSSFDRQWAQLLR
jgi:glycosyltransferase involved in cell wall biosynthesis/predicted SAM-dependent methyltransferase